MLIDFTLIDNNEIKMLEFSEKFAVADLEVATKESIEIIHDLIKDLNDEQVVFIAKDAAAGDEDGWNIAHLVMHATATAEEAAAVSSVLARGILYPFEPRLRYETDWQTVTTAEQCLQRVKESARIRLGYLSAWPDTPQLNIYRGLPEPMIERFGQLNATASYLLGLWHEQRHFDQLREIVRQATAG
ncbi:DinB family protein [soil metagenome]